MLILGVSIKTDTNVINVTLLYMPDIDLVSINNTNMKIILIFVSYGLALNITHGFKIHIKTLHSENTTDTFCQYCNNKYRDKSLLDKRIRRCHEKWYKCAQCNF